MNRAVVLAFLIAAVVCINAFPQGHEHHQQCGLNEEFQSCGTCTPTCQNPNPTVCTMDCVIGCQCKKGYVRNSEGKCVLTRDC